MDFFERQEKAHRKTKLLVVYFIAGVSMMILTIYLACTVIFSGVTHSRHYQRYYSNSYPQSGLTLWNPELFAGVSLLTLAVISIGSLYKISQLSGGGSAVPDMMGGRLVAPNSTDPDERKLLNVVEEMSIASGVPA